MEQIDRQNVQTQQIEQYGIGLEKSNQERLGFIIEEYRMLRTEIESYTNQKRQLEISVVTVILATYAFTANAELTTKSILGKTLETVVLALPFLIAVGGFGRFIFYNKVIKKEVQYVREKIEPTFLGLEGGWDVYWEKTKTWDILRRTEYFFWGLVFLITLVVPILWNFWRTP